MFATLRLFMKAFTAFMLASTLLKVITFTIMYFLIRHFVPVIGAMIPGVSDIQALLLAMPPSVHYFLHYFEIPTGISMILSAAATAFIIRRIPFIS